jgi:hypothetical protein
MVFIILILFFQDNRTEQPLKASFNRSSDTEDNTASDSRLKHYKIHYGLWFKLFLLDKSSDVNIYLDSYLLTYSLLHSGL